MRSKAWLGVAMTSVALAPTLSACVDFRDPFPTKTVTATATTAPTTPQQISLRAWRDATLVPAQEVRDAAGKIVKAGQNFDLTSMGIACQEEKDAVELFQEHMPSPDSAVNAPLQKALSDYSSAATICTTAVENRNFDDFKQATTIVGEANTYMDDALNILHADLGESSTSAAPQSPLRPSEPAAVDPEQDSSQQLQNLAISDRPFIQANLAGWWIPQLSSKSSTEPWTIDPENGVLYEPAQILLEHQQLRQKYPGIVRLLWAGDWSTFSAPNFWVTVVADTFSESADALAWCRSQGLDQDHCSATHLHN